MFQSLDFGPIVIADGIFFHDVSIRHTLAQNHFKSDKGIFRRATLRQFLQHLLQQFGGPRVTDQSLLDIGRQEGVVALEFGKVGHGRDERLVKFVRVHRVVNFEGFLAQEKVKKGFRRTAAGHCRHRRCCNGCCGRRHWFDGRGHTQRDFFHVAMVAVGRIHKDFLGILRSRFGALVGSCVGCCCCDNTGAGLLGLILCADNTDADIGRRS
mmetsp:Transcript_14809/g.35545  ORF Transcript_14809/g.35545 Transcript_14809/m.35545 type:complete len:211 (+) Transcript_14809:1447-2079(+)